MAFIRVKVKSLKRRYAPISMPTANSFAWVKGRGVVKDAKEEARRTRSRSALRRYVIARAAIKYDSGLIRSLPLPYFQPPIFIP